MNTEQILIRMGIDAKAVVSGLNDVSTYTKAWGWSMSQTIKNVWKNIPSGGSAFSGFKNSLTTAAGYARSWSATVSNIFANTFNRLPAPVQKVSNGIFESLKGAFTRTSAFASGWGTSLMHELKGKLGGLLAAGFAVEQLNELKNEIIEIKRLSEETGTNTNFIQSLMVESKISGTSIEALTMPLIHFNKTIGDAKQGLPGAVNLLHDMGIIMKGSEVGALNLTTGMMKLKEQFDKLGDAQKQDALLNDAFGKSAFRMSPIFRQTARDFEAMFEGNFFTKMSTSAIDTVGDLQTGFKMVGQTAMSVGVNSLNAILTPYKKLSQAIGILASGQIPTLAKLRAIDQQSIEDGEKKARQAFMQNLAEKDGITVQEEKTKILNDQNELLERQAELTSEINDQNKPTLQAMADHARKLLGIRKPQNYTVSKEDREALRIDTLDERAKNAYERGDTKTGRSLTNEANQARAGLGDSFGRKDKFPMAKTEVELARVNAQLEPVKRMADLIVTEHHKPK